MGSEITTPNETTAKDSILAVDQTKLQQSETAGNTALARLRDAHCDTEEQERAFADFMNRAHTIVKDLEAEREVMVRPLLDGKSEIDKLYKAARTPWENVKALCKLKIARVQTMRRKLEDDARALALAAAQADDTDKLEAAVNALVAPTQAPGASITWEWTVKNIRKGEMPLEYLVPDMDAIKAVCRMHKHSERPPVIQGVTFERTANVGVR
jgi:hypothetical protein